MDFKELDLKIYQNIPVYDMGYGEPCGSPIVICRYNNDTHGLGPIHRHKIFQMNYIVKGQLLHQINNTKYPVGPGDMFVIPPYIPHQIIDEKGEGYEIMELEFMPTEVFGSAVGPEQKLADSKSLYDFSYIEPFLVSECNVRPRLTLTGKRQLEAVNLLNDMLHEFEEQADGYQLAMKADLSKLMVLASRTFKESIENKPERQLLSHHRTAISETIRYINEHLGEPLKIEDISKMALLSQSYFSYLFKILTGMTFVEYLNTQRITKALKLIQTTDDNILDICLACGFNSINHFNRIFKRIVHMSPRQYRKANEIFRKDMEPKEENR